VKFFNEKVVVVASHDHIVVVLESWLSELTFRVSILLSVDFKVDLRLN